MAAPRRNNPTDTLRLLLWCVLTMAVAACANMGRPEGGARDEDPPVFLRSNPAPGATGVDRNRMTLTFNENVQLEDAFNRVVVSPPQKTPPQVSANGRTVTVTFRDSLLPATTYTVDFADAIKDLNEGNVLDGFALDFSTGDSIDTLRISGMVLQAENLEPAQGMLVGVYPDSVFTDTTLAAVPMQRIARTNQLGQFTIRNLPAGLYRIFAINDVNRDYHWDRSEDIAFYDTVIRPTTEVISIVDTLYSSTGADSLVHRNGIRYLPNDVLLTWFNLGYKAPYLADYKRPERRKITLTFGAPQDTLPSLAIVDGAPGAGRMDSLWSLRESNATGDTLVYWLRDPDVLAADSLRLAVNYKKLDSLEQPVWVTDTLRFFFKDPKPKKKKKDDEEPAPTFSIDSITGDTVPLLPPDFDFVTIQAIGGTSQDVNRDVVLSFSQPLESLSRGAWRLTALEDTVWLPVVGATLVPDSLSPVLQRRLSMPWTPGGKYRLEIDSLAATGIYGTWNKDFRHEFTVKQLEDYSNLHVDLPGLDSLDVVVQLLSSGDAPVYTAAKAAGEKAVDFKFVAPATYYMRLYLDSNANGRYDVGDPATGAQPEEVYYFAKKLELRKNWDVEQSWDIYELPLDRQKPYAIKQNKPKLKRGEKPPVDPDEEYDDDPFGTSQNRDIRDRNGSSGHSRNPGLKRNNFR
ncbi:MAG: Ig-like domain-containing protein [Muribaculaceae bacterium]|nr:Ig-like domain-containing protein [Muribaculaceae bacterium]